MVHALEQIPGLLNPDGYLVDIRPIDAGDIEVRRGAEKLFAAPDPAYDTDGSREQAQRALDGALERGRYKVEEQNEFDVLTYAASAAEMQAYWESYEAYDEAPDEGTRSRNEVYARAGEVIQKTPGAEISYRERVRITRLRPIAPRP